jgi:CRISPR-associated endonuclease Csn1
MLRYRLALDVGTASLGLVAVLLKEDGTLGEVLFCKVWIFSEPLLPGEKGGVGATKQSHRRTKRLARRVIERRARRLHRIAGLAHLLGLKRESVTAAKGLELPRIRALAATQKISLDDLLRIFLNMSKRRGYSGGFKLGSRPGEVSRGIDKLKAQMDEKGHKTFGQFRWARIQPLKDNPNSLDKSPNSLKFKDDPAGLYVERQMVVDEFNIIWNAQEKHYPFLAEKGIKQQFSDALFFQRPLKSVKGMVGNCLLETNLPRAPLAHPAFQEFRIEKQLADLRWGMGQRAMPLAAPQKNVIRRLLRSQETVSFNSIYSALGEANCMQAHPKSLNMDRASRDVLPPIES